MFLGTGVAKQHVNRENPCLRSPVPVSDIDGDHEPSVNSDTLICLLYIL